PNKFLGSVSGYQASYRTLSAEQRSNAEAQLRSGYQICAAMPFYCQIFNIPAGISEADYVAANIKYAAKENTIEWRPDAEGRFHRADNPCSNGALAGVADLFEGGNCRIGNTANPIASRYAVAKKRRDGGWAPSLTVTGLFSDYSRAYLSYNEALRYPNMFESVIAFGASVSPFRDLKPEHTCSYELGYIQELGHLLGDDTIADVKLSYYHRRTDDLIERDNNFLFRNIDKQLVQGVEFQGRYDNGRFFTDLAVAHTLKNEVCDEHTAITIDPNVAGTPTCVDQGFIGSWLLTQASPETSANWSLGGRFLDKRLELGTRVVYYQRRKPNRDLEAFAAVTNQNLA
ncbi:MAG: TonB-dependent receptor, partial [Stenotrophomonas sp.]